MSRLLLIKKTINENVNLPDGVRFYLFGSVINASITSDIDLLCIYDPAYLAPNQAYVALQPIFLDLRQSFGCPLHPVILSEAEEREVCFVESEGCISVSD